MLLAVSGGLDSICLAHYFTHNKESLGIKWLGIAHVHHGLRETTADRDAEFVQNFANKFNIPFFLKKLDGVALKAADGSLEENARIARYNALHEIIAEILDDDSLGPLKQHKTIAIATAHHAGDQAETVYLRLRRGVTLAGLRGIQANAQTSAKIPIVRPFLNTTRQQLLEYARKNGLSWCDDESNSDIKFARNFIRHQSLPYLEKKFPGAGHQLCAIAKSAANAYKKILASADALFLPAIIAQEDWPFALEFTPFKKVLALNALLVEEKLTTPGTAEIFRLWLNERGFRLPLKESGTSLTTPIPFKMHCKAITIEKSRNILWIYDTSSADFQKKDVDNLYFVSDKFSGLDGAWRYRETGDALCPRDEKIKARKLEKWLREQGIPPFMHDHLPLFAQGSKVLYVEGVKRTKNKRKV